MKTHLLPANTHIVIPVATTRRGQMQLRVESERPVEVGIVNAREVEEFRKTGNLGGFGFRGARSRHNIEMMIDPGDWYLLIANFGKVPTSVGWTIS